MSFKEMQDLALQISRAYKDRNVRDGHKEWGVSEYVSGFVGDVGDLSKLVMAKEKYREIENVDEKIKHELSDCLWSIFVIAHEMNIDLEKAYLDNMQELERKVRSNE